jgi:hypothetical protein
LRITEILREPGGGIRIRWGAEPGRSYQVEISENLEDWEEVGLPVLATSEVAEYGDQATVTAARFYRVHPVN